MTLLFALVKAKEKGVLPTNIGSWSRTVAYVPYEAVAGYYWDGFHDENVVFEQIVGIHNAGTFKVVVSDLQ